jgi:hypothetical protein
MESAEELEDRDGFSFEYDDVDEELEVSVPEDESVVGSEDVELDDTSPDLGSDDANGDEANELGRLESGNVEVDTAALGAYKFVML